MGRYYSQRYMGTSRKSQARYIDICMPFLFIGWAADKNETNFGIGMKYALDKNASLRAKVNNSSQVGLGYQQKLREGVTLTLSALIDGKNVEQGGHKLGIALELDM